MKDLAQERCLPIVGIQRVHDSFRGASGVQRGELRTRWWGWSWASCVGEGPGQLTDGFPVYQTGMISLTPRVLLRLKCNNRTASS